MLYRIRDVTHNHRAREVLEIVSLHGMVMSHSYKEPDNKGGYNTVDLEVLNPLSQDVLKKLNEDRFWVYAPGTEKRFWQFIEVDE